jgi:hypothetical protein
MCSLRHRCVGSSHLPYGTCVQHLRAGLALSPNNVYTSIRGEVFDLSKVTQAHLRVVNVVPSKSILNYDGQSADAIFPVQVCQV